MSDTKISALTAGATILDADEFAVNEAGTSKKLTALQLAQQPNYHRFHIDWLNGPVPPNVTVTGSGSGLASAHRGISLATGTTNPSSAGIYGHMEPGVTASAGGLISKVRRIEIQCMVADTLANANTYFYITDEAVATIPTGTPRHFGIKNLNGTVTFTTADGTTEQTTAITSFITAAKAHAFIITFDGTTAKLYIDGTLQATHATNVPAAGGASVLRAFVNNNSTVNARTVSVLGVDVLWLNG